MNYVYHTAHKGLKREGAGGQLRTTASPIVPPQETMPRVYFSKPVCPSVPFSQAAAVAGAPLTWLGYDITKQSLEKTHTQGQGKGWGLQVL